eukprot:3804756-Pleurochrysis_carterae.AAC.1
MVTRKGELLSISAVSTKNGQILRRRRRNKAAAAGSSSSEADGLSQEASAQPAAAEASLDISQPQSSRNQPPEAGSCTATSPMCCVASMNQHSCCFCCSTRSCQQLRRHRYQHA